MKLIPELIEKARGAKTAEELLTLAKENGDTPVDSVCSLCERAVWQQGLRWVCSL